MHRRDVPEQEIIDAYKEYWRRMRELPFGHPNKDYSHIIEALPWHTPSLSKYPEKLIKAKAYHMAKQGKLKWFGTDIYEVP